MKHSIASLVSLAVLFSFGFASAETVTAFPGTTTPPSIEGSPQQKPANKPVGQKTQAPGNIQPQNASAGTQNPTKPGVKVVNAQLQVQTPPPVNASCMASAISNRDNRIIVAFDVFHAEARAKLQTRVDAQSGAWSLAGDARVQANKTAWDKWRNDIRSSKETFRSAKSAAWNQFKIDRTACGVKSSAEAGTSGMDSSL